MLLWTLVGSSIAQGFEYDANMKIQKREDKLHTFPPPEDQSSILDKLFVATPELFDLVRSGIHTQLWSALKHKMVSTPGHDRSAWGSFKGGATAFNWGAMPLPLPGEAETGPTSRHEMGRHADQDMIPGVQFRNEIELTTADPYSKCKLLGGFFVEPNKCWAPGTMQKLDYYRNSNLETPAQCGFIGGKHIDMEQDDREGYWPNEPAGSRTTGGCYVSGDWTLALNVGGTYCSQYCPSCAMDIDYCWLRNHWMGENGAGHTILMVHVSDIPRLHQDGYRIRPYASYPGEKFPFLYGEVTLGSDLDRAKIAHPEHSRLLYLEDAIDSNPLAKSSFVVGMFYGERISRVQVPKDGKGARSDLKSEPAVGEAPVSHDNPGASVFIPGRWEPYQLRPEDVLEETRDALSEGKHFRFDVKNQYGDPRYPPDSSDDLYDIDMTKHRYAFADTLENGHWAAAVCDEQDEHLQLACNPQSSTMLSAGDITMLEPGEIHKTAKWSLIKDSLYSKTEIPERTGYFLSHTLDADLNLLSAPDPETREWEEWTHDCSPHKAIVDWPYYAKNCKKWLSLFRGIQEPLFFADLTHLWWATTEGEARNACKEVYKGRFTKEWYAWGGTMIMGFKCRTATPIIAIFGNNHLQKLEHACKHIFEGTMAGNGKTLCILKRREELDVDYVSQRLWLCLLCYCLAFFLA